MIISFPTSTRRGSRVLAALLVVGAILLPSPTLAGAQGDAQIDVSGDFEDSKGLDEGAVDEGAVDEGVTGDPDAPDVMPVVPDLAEIGQGECSPAVLVVNQVATCRFPVTGGTESLLNWNYEAKLLMGDRLEGESDPCVIEGDELVCRDLLATFPEDEFPVLVPVLIPALSHEYLASITISPDDGVALLVSADKFPMQTFAGSAINVEALRSYDQPSETQIDLLLRRDGEENVLARVPGVAPGEEWGMAEITFPEGGRFTLAGCEVATDDADGVAPCVKEGVRRAFDAVDPAPLPLVADHNDRSAERINLVFVGNGFGPESDLTLQELAVSLLSFDGEPELHGDDGLVWDVSFGPFAIEPLLDNVEKFNFWFLEHPIDMHRPPFDGLDPAPLLDPSNLGLGPDVIMILVDQSHGRSTATMPSFVEEVYLDPDAPRRLGSIHLALGATSWLGPEVLAHELGHALFGLRDEYVETEYQSGGVFGIPNCASSESQAQEMWGDMVGEVDPMFDRWTAILEDRNLAFAMPEREDFMVGVVPGGCFAQATSTTTFRPTADSLMNSNVPVLGAVNRARAERVLAMWPDPPTPAPAPTTTTTTPEVTTTTTTEALIPTTTVGETPDAEITAADGIATSHSPQSSSMAAFVLFLGGLAAVLLFWVAPSGRRGRNSSMT